VPTTLIAKNLMQAQLWGIKTFYYSLLNKQGAKAAAEDIPPQTGQLEEYIEEDCESCKL
jgi:hypothetical protein